jgi:hypothetical protein
MAEKINETLNPIKFNSRVSVPTATGTDPSEVVNIDYFHNNATKVDWEHIYSDVHIMDSYNFSVGEALIAQSEDECEDISNQIQWCTTVEPGSGTPQYWFAYQAFSPDYFYFPVVAGKSYRLASHSASISDSFYGSNINIFPYQPEEVSIYNSNPDISYPPLANVSYYEYDNGEWNDRGEIISYPEAKFTAPVSGFAYIPVYKSNTPNWEVCELSHYTTVNGDLEVLGDLSFGADSHIVFGTIEGTDFIADYAKVKNAPTENDDVVNLKTLKEWVPTKKEYLTVTRGDYSKTLENVSYNETHNDFYDPNASYSFGYALLDPETTYYIDVECMGEVVTGELTTTIVESQSVSAFNFTAHDGQSYTFPSFTTLQPASSYDGQLDCHVVFQEIPVFGNISIYKKTTAPGGADISDYQGNAKINGNLEVTGNLSINGKRVLTEDDLANLVAYPAAEDYTF